MSPYNYAFNNPVMWNDLSGAAPGWVDTGDGGEKIIYNSNIGSQEAAQAVYGDNAQFYGSSKEEYTGSDGSKYQLFSDGSYSKDGTTYKAKDHSSFTDHYAIILKSSAYGGLSGVLNLISFLQSDPQTAARLTTEGYVNMAALGGSEEMSYLKQKMDGTYIYGNHHGFGDWTGRSQSNPNVGSGGLNKTQLNFINDIKSWDEYKWYYKTSEFATNTALSYGLGKALMPYPNVNVSASSVSSESLLGTGISKPKYINLASEQRTTHIIAGDATGGGHSWFGSIKSFKNGISGKKSMFPMNWSSEKIMHASSDVLANYPSIQQSGPAGSLYTKSGQLSKFVSNGEYQGLKIRVVYNNADIITAFPVGNSWFSKFFHFSK
jgi:hypothetical protein